MVVSAIIVGAATVGSQIYASNQQKKQQKKQLALQRQANAVSYTHLTLPTTPYV